MLAPLLPNLLFILLPPQRVPPAQPSGAARGHLALTMLERGGQAGVVLLPLFLPMGPFGPWQWVAAAAMAAGLLFYAAGWLRYLRGGRGYRLLFAPMAGVPAPMAISPALYFLALAVLLRSPWMAAAAAMFAAGHVPISLRSGRALPNEMPSGAKGKHKA